MVRYIQAELGRLGKKKSNYIFYITLMALFTLVTFFIDGDKRTASTFYAMIINLIPFIMFLVCVQTFIAVYVDDVSGHVLATTLSSGVGKSTLVISKVIVSLIYNIAIFIVLGLFLLAHMFIFGGSFDKMGIDFLTMMVKQVMFMILTMSTMNTLGGIILYLTQKSTVGITTLVMIAIGLVSQLLNLLTILFPPLSKFFEWLPDILFNSGIVEIANSALSISKIVAMFAWLVGGVIVSTIVLRKKELEL